MNEEILTVTIPDSEAESEISKAAAGYPAALAGDVREAFLATLRKDYKKSADICRSLLKHKAVPEIQTLLGVDYLSLKQFCSAEEVFLELAAEYPEEEAYHIYHGVANHALGRYEDAVKELGALYPLKKYRPFYYSSYGDCLQQLGKLQQSREAFYKDVEYFDQTGEIVSPEMLDGAFQNLLFLDITLGDRRYSEDIQIYYRFLERVEMTDVMQRYLAGTIVRLCGLMTTKWCGM